MLRPTQMSDLLLMTLVDPLPFAGLMTIGLYARIAAHRLSGHTAAASSVGWPVPSAWRGTALCSGRAGRCQCACGEGACSQAGDHRFGQRGSSAEPSIVPENGPRFALAYVYFEAEPSRRSGGESSPHGGKTAATTATERMQEHQQRESRKLPARRPKARSTDSAHVSGALRLFISDTIACLDTSDTVRA